MSELSSTSVVHNASQQRFELQIEGRTAFLSYVRQKERFIFDHTFVPDELRGRGIAAILTNAALIEAQKGGWKIVPQCSYVAAYMERHSEFNHLLASKSQP